MNPYLQGEACSGAPAAMLCQSQSVFPVAVAAVFFPSSTLLQSKLRLGIGDKVLSLWTDLYFSVENNTHVKWTKPNLLEERPNQPLSISLTYPEKDYLSVTVSCEVHNFLSIH